VSDPSRDPSHYERLGVSPRCSPDELKASYRKLARERHPDALKGRGIAPESAEAARLYDEMLAINEAYRVLSDPELRARYDDDLRAEAARAAQRAAEGAGARSGSPARPIAPPRVARALAAALVVAMGAAMLLNLARPNPRRVQQELGAAEGLLKPHVDGALRGEVPSLKEGLESPQGALLRGTLAPASPPLTPDECLRAFPDDLAPRRGAQD
jgi:curved DNA-binding protein CbpA